MKEVDIAASGLTGYLGAATLPKMLNAGLKVRLLVRDRGRAQTALGESIYNDNLEILCVDNFSSKSALEYLVKNARCIVHAVAVADPIQVIERSVEAKKTNIDLTRYLLDAHQKFAKDSAFVFLSSLSVFGGNLGFCDSTTTPVWKTEHSRQKLMLEERILGSIANAVVVRLGTCVGVLGNPNRMRDDLFFNKIAKHAVMGKGVLRVFGALQNTPYVHIEDAGRLLTFCAKQLSSCGSMNERCLNVVTRNMTKREVGQTVLETVGVNNIDFFDALQGDDLCDCSVKSELFEKIGFRLDHKDPQLWAIELVEHYSKYKRVAA